MGIVQAFGLLLVILGQSAALDPLEEFGLTQAELEAMVASHNTWRMKVKSKDMHKLMWDNNLAKDAMYWAKQCKFYHGDPPTATRSFTSGTKGQNIGYTTQSAAKKDAIFDEWAGESDYYEFASNMCWWEPCKHYTQLMWSNHLSVGCAYWVCPTMEDSKGVTLDKNAKYLVCNYSPQGNVNGQKPWLAGEPCSSCPYCHTVDKLCLTEEQCNKDKTNCKCMKECQHCGTLTADCQCKCTKGTYGTLCENFCRDKLESCASYSKSDCPGDTYISKTLRGYCLRLCGACDVNTDTSWTCGKETFSNTFAMYASAPKRGYKTLDNKVCKFPFVYNGKYHHKCLPYGSSDWCSETVDYDKYRTYGTGCRKIATTGGTGNAANCAFPFVYKGSFEYKCLYDIEKKKNWCGTTENYDTDKKYGWCVLTGAE